jgi:hypothetical protein
VTVSASSSTTVSVTPDVLTIVTYECQVPPAAVFWST